MDYKLDGVRLCPPEGDLVLEVGGDALALRYTGVGCCDMPTIDVLDLLAELKKLDLPQLKAVWNG